MPFKNRFDLTDSNHVKVWHMIIDSRTVNLRKFYNYCNDMYFERLSNRNEYLNAYKIGSWTNIKEFTVAIYHVVVLDLLETLV